MVSGSDDKSVRMWDVETGDCLHVFQGDLNGPIGCELVIIHIFIFYILLFSRSVQYDGRLVLAADDDVGVVKVFNSVSILHSCF